MYDPHTRESRGFGFVTMESGEEADAAITAMNGTELMGKSVSVEKVRAPHSSLPPCSDRAPCRLVAAARGLPPPAATTARRRGTTVGARIIHHPSLSDTDPDAS